MSSECLLRLLCRLSEAGNSPNSRHLEVSLLAIKGKDDGGARWKEDFSKGHVRCQRNFARNNRHASSDGQKRECSTPTTSFTLMGEYVHVNIYIWPLISTFWKAADLAPSKNLRALPVRSFTSPSSFSSRKLCPPWSQMNLALSSSDSKPSSSVTKRSLTSGLYLSPRQ